MGDCEQVGPPRPNLLETEVDGDISIYDPGSERVVVLNQTASDVWRLTDGQHTIDEIVELLARAYEVDVHSISDDVGQAVEGFVDAGLIDGR